MKKAILVGVPNCGKSTVFSALTGARVKIGNWAGVTVERKSGRMRFAENAILVDTPGISGARATGAEERVTEEVLREGDYDLLIQVLDAAALARSLALTRSLSGIGKPMILVLNRIDLAARDGKTVDARHLAEEIGGKIFPVSALTGEGMAELTEGIRSCLFGREEPQNGIVFGKNASPAQVAAKVTRGGDGAHSFPRAFSLDKVLLSSPLSFPILFAVLALLFFATTAAFSLFGDLFGTLSETLSRAAERGLLSLGASPFFAGAVARGFLGGWMTALSFLPPLAVFYTLTAALEDSGYLARASFLLDPPLSLIGLSGAAVIPFLLSAGCGVSGVCACRTLRDKEKNACAGVSTWIPCHAKLPIIACVCAYCGFSPLGASLFFLLPTALAVGGAALLSRDGGYLAELPRLACPSGRGVARSVLWRCEEFFLRAGTLIALSSFCVWLFSHISPAWRPAAPDGSILAALGQGLYPLFAPLGFRGWEAVTATLAGFLAKENAAVTLTLLGGTGVLGGRGGAVAFCLFQLLSPPCVAASVTVRHTVGRRAYLYFLLQVAVAALCAAVGARLFS